jgi:hypothetical protein
MLVTTYRDGTAHTGLLVGEADARRYFPNREGSIELQLDGLEIQCALEPDFWKGRPRISDPRLSVWLEFKVGRGRFGRHPMVMSLVPAGAGKFVLRPEATPVFQAFGADVALLPQPESGVFDSLELESRSVA